MSHSNPILLFFLFFLFISCFKLSYAIFCPLIEKQSLLSFKQSLLDPYHRLSSWNSEVNCCKWKGVVCNNSTGHVHQLYLHGLIGKINPSLLNLKHLSHLDLSLNNFGETIPLFIGSFTNIEYLNLSFSGFHGKVPHNIGNLLYLRSLDLSGFPQYMFADAISYPNLLNVDSLQWLSGLSKLEHLNMNFVNLSKANNWLQVINTLPSNLLQLHFRNCSLEYISPTLYFFNITSLTLLDLSSNCFQAVDVPTWIFQLGNLLSLDISNNSFIGPIPTVSNTTKLRHIDLSLNILKSTIPSWLYSCKDLEVVLLGFNFLHGTVPAEFTNLCKMQLLSLIYNNFEGIMSDSFGNMSECFLESLKILDLAFNQLSGHLTNQLGEFKSLRFFAVVKNSLSGTIPFTLGKLSSLRVLQLSGNKLTGNLPESLGQLYNLEFLYIIDNKLEGVVTESFFANLTKLEVLSASHNQLSLKVGQHWVPPFQLKLLGLGSWNLGTNSQIPSWLETQKNFLGCLDLSDTGISGSVPDWFWEIQTLDLSHNRFRGKIPNLLHNHSHGDNLNVPGLNYVQVISLSCNQFEGLLPRIGGSLRELDLSNNSFSGGIAHFLCDDRYDTYSLEVLHLGDNLLSGELPNCWMKWPSLRYLSLGNNQMIGTIPNSIGFLENLESLNLHSNGFSGQIPFSLRNCTKLLKMGLAENNLGGNIPTWIGRNLVQLRILLLSSNSLSGEISSEICHLTSLQILDLSNNKLSGIIPRCLYNFTAMVTKRSLPDMFRIYPNRRPPPYAYSVYMGGLTESALIVKKGSKLQYGSILPLVTTIDLSMNNLRGDIPSELTSLLELGSLNLSRNELRGLIPENIGDMKLLESLDLSRNSLSGSIPNSLARISSLEYLDLSYNNLTGGIPQGTQLQSFDASRFVGNDLCGPPLTSSCSSDGVQAHGNAEKEKNENGDDEGIEWFYLVLSLGYAVGFSMVCTALVLMKRWRYAYFGFVESIWNKLCVYLIIRWARLRAPSAPTL